MPRDCLILSVVSVDSSPDRPLTFDVFVRDARSESRHRVVVSQKDAAVFASLSAGPPRGVEAAMRFLLDREPKESILGAFDIDVIRRYFPEFDEALPLYVGRTISDPGESA